MTPVGQCPGCADGHLTPTATPGWTRCPACLVTFDSLGNGYNHGDWSLVSRRGLS